jgi:MFS family permease
MTTMNDTDLVATPPAASGPQLLRPFRFNDFRLLFTGESISVIGDNFHFVALAWLVLQLTGSGLALGSVLMVAAVPRVIFMLVGGALSDRFSPRSLMLYSNGLRAVVVGIVAALVLSDHAALWQLYIMAGIFGVVDALFYPATSAIVPMLVDEPTLAPANALMQGSQQFATLAGPVLAGLLVAWVQTGPAFVFDAVSFAIAAVALSFVVGGRRTASDTEAAADEAAPSLLATIGAGFRYAWGDPPVRALIFLTAAFNLAFTGPLLVGLPFMSDHSLGGGSATFGILLSAFGAGALLGAVAAGSIGRMPRLGLIVLLVAIGLGIGLALLGLAPNVPIAFVVLAAMGLGGGFLNVHLISWLQGRSAPDMRGRVMSMVMLGSVGLAPISYAVAGAIVDLGPIPLMFAVAGAIVVAASLAGFAAGIATQMVYAPGEAEQP